ncbi:MAG TPA: efflux RND transporter periplasmic adaptor subunit [Chryseosolibacter sp.]
MKTRWQHILWLLILATACEKQTQEGHTNHYKHNENDAISIVSRPVNQVVLSSQKTIKPIRGSNKNAFKAVGYIDFDERRSNKVAVRTSGRIEKLYVKYNYQYVKKGQAIADIYSPELNTYQEEYLFLLKSSEDSLAEKAKQKLELLGLSQSQILQLETSGLVTQTIAISSPVDGFIRFSSDAGSTEGMSLSKGPMSPMAGFSSENSRPAATSSSAIEEGAYVNKGQTLFVVNDCRKVSAILSADIASEAKIKKGDSVKLSPEVSAGQIRTAVDLVEQVYHEKQRFTQMRAYLDNPMRTLKINSLINAEFISGPSGLIVPASSVYDLGTRKIVWVKTGETEYGIGLFEPRIVSTGISLNNLTEILSGLTADEDIALDAGYMLDAEDILEENP